MKLSELSYREYIALQALPAFLNAGTMIDHDAAWRAFGAADAFLKQTGKEYREVAEQREHAETAERALVVLRETIISMLEKPDETSTLSGLRALFGVKQP